MKRHQLEEHGWSKDKSYCDYANWWDGSFWCGNNRCFKTVDVSRRECPMIIPVFNKCKMKKSKIVI